MDLHAIFTLWSKTFFYLHWLKEPYVFIYSPMRMYKFHMLYVFKYEFMFGEQEHTSKV